MTFGRHKGQPLSEIPSDYLVWILEHANNAKPYLRKAIEREMARREHDDNGKQHTASGNLTNGIIRTWFRELCLKFHPDRGGHVEAMKAINHAHDRLKDLVRKA
jgi:hypothetical protein